MNDAQIKHMVDRFLAWKLPEDFRPDGGISFKAEHSEEFMAAMGKPPMRHEPTGTNLFGAHQAEAMVRHIVAGMDHGREALVEALKEANHRAEVAEAAAAAMAEERDAGRVVLEQGQ